MSQIFNEEDLEAVLSINASNAFSAVNPDLVLHNVRVACPEIAVFVRNCYALPPRLFILGGSELKTCDQYQAEQILGKKTKSVAYADDFTGK